VLAEVSYTALEGEVGTEERVPTASKTDDFAADAILLVGKGKRGECSAGEVVKRYGRSSGAHRTNPKLYVHEAKGTSVRNGASVLTGAKQEKESNDDHVGNGVIARICSSVGGGHDVAEDLNRNGLNAVGRWILPFVARELALQTKVHFSMAV
jgi:hypothetical protein